MTERKKNPFVPKTRRPFGLRVPAPVAPPPHTRPRPRWQRMGDQLYALFMMAAGGYVMLKVTTILLAPVLDAQAATEARALTSAEALLVHSVFGENFDTSSITVHRHEKQPVHFFDHLHMRFTAGLAPIAYVNGMTMSDIHAIGDVYVDDYARAGDTGLTGIFMHEVTHLWQSRRARFFQWPFVQDRYTYELQEGKRLEHYSNEQQGEIIRHYVSYYISPVLTDDFTRTRHLAVAPSPQAQALADTVENTLPAARATRVQLQQEYNQVVRCMIQGTPTTPIMHTRFSGCADAHISLRQPAAPAQSPAPSA